jgi:hypothetical protein
VVDCNFCAKPRNPSTRAWETKANLQYALRELSWKEHQRKQECDLEKVNNIRERGRYDQEEKYTGSFDTPTDVAAGSELLGSARHKNPPGVGRQPHV